jgi:hypothetical protein
VPDKGYLPLDFCAEDESRAFEGVEEPDPVSIPDYFKCSLADALKAGEDYTPDWWTDERYYVQMLVEKVDLKSLFVEVCGLDHIPIATSSGWSDINQRAEIAKRFLEAKARGLKCVCSTQATLIYEA